jgi:acyl-CoA thioester hydrolase
METLREQYPYFHRLRVRYSEIDGQGIVFNAHYLTYFDVALTEFMRERDFDFVELVRSEQLDFHLVKSLVEYRLPIRMDQLIDIGVRAARVGNSSVTWHLGIFPADDATCLACGEIVWVCSKIGEHKSHPLPEVFRRSLPAPD